MPFVILPTNSASGGYDITNSLRFNSGSSDYLNRTLTTPTSAYIGTFSHWIKRSVLGGAMGTFSAWDNGGTSTNRAYLNLNSDTIYFYDEPSGMIINTNALYRDVSAWYHIVIAWDTTQATASNRVKVYVNGTQESSFQTATYPAQNTTLQFNTSGRRFGIGCLAIGSSAALFFDGYVSETYFIDGQQLTPTSFGETDTDTGIWKPKAFSGTYGTNGFYLQFKNSASLGTDSSGNGNTFTVNNLTSIDQTTDTPTNNFATLNPIAAQAGSGASSAVNTFTEGNLKVADLASDTAISNFGVSTGKWFWEVQVVTDQDGIAIGACNDGFHLNAELGYNSPASQANGKVFGYYGSGSKFTTIGDGTHFSAYGSAIAVNDIIGVALNLDTNEVTFYKNGTSQGTFSITALGSGENYFPAIGNWSAGSVVANFNFGSPPFTIASGNTDGAGFGNFEYAVPSGYYALNTKNLANFG